MTVAHFLYIPAMLGMGVLIGYILRGRVDRIRLEDGVSPAPNQRDAAKQARERAKGER